MAACLKTLRAVIYCAVTISTFAVGNATAQQFADPQFKSYPLKSTQPAAVEDALRRFLSDRLDNGAAIEIVSDARAGRILVRGTNEIQQLADQFIQAVDLPPAQPAQAQAPRYQQYQPQAVPVQPYQTLPVQTQPIPQQQVQQPASRVHGYRAASAEELAQKAAGLKARFAQNPSVRIAPDERTRQIVVHAPEAVHQQITTNWNNPQYYVVQQQAAPAAYGQQPVAPSMPSNIAPLGVASSGPQTQTQKQLQLENISWQQLLKSLRGVQGPNAAVSSMQDGMLQLSVTSPSGPPTQLLIDQQNQRVQISGAANDTTQWTRVVQSLDSKPTKPEVLQMTGRLGDAQPTTITRTITMLGTSGAGQAAIRPLGQQRLPDGNVQQMFAQQGRGPLRVAQADTGQPGGGVVEQRGALGQGQAGGNGGEVIQLADQSGSFLGPVAIEFLEGTDIFIVRGQQRDVDRVMKIINDIERLTQDTEPTVEVYPLKHANSEAVATLVNDLNENVLNARQGDVSVTPLIKPNSVLLIGRPSGVASVVKIIEKLDVEAEASDQFRVFQLKHLPAVDAETTINNIYVTTQTGTTTPTGLGPRVRAVADFRSNSLVVQASPRDLKEIEDLLKEIDVKGSTTVSEVQVFRLKNAFAEEVAEVLNETLGTNQSSQAQGNTGNQGQGGTGAGGQVNTQANSSRQSQALRIKMLDAEGKQLLDNKILESGILSNVVVSFNERVNAVVVTAPEGSMELIAEIVRQLDDLAAQEAEIRVINIVNGDATLLTEMLDTLFAQADTNNGALLQSAAGTGESTLVPLRFAVDQRTNSIIVSGNGADLEVVEAILLKLDLSDVTRRKSAVVELQIQQAVNVAAAITDFVAQRREAILGIAQDTTSQYDLLDQEVVVVAEEASNKLIVNATDRYFDDIMKIIEDLDRRQDMVMVKVMIAEVELNSTEEMGVELGIQDSLLFNRSVAGVPGFNFNNQALGNNSTSAGSARDQVAGQAIADFGLGRQNGELGYGGLVLSASNESVSVLIRALQEARRLDVITSPKVQMLNNTTGEVTVGSRVPYIQGTSLTQGVVQNQITFENVGIILSITPRIGRDGVVVLDVLAEKSDLGSDEEGVPISVQDGVVLRAPPINTTRARTFVTAQNGQTVILGGLITKERAAFERKVPYLADIPFFGRLFRTDGVAEQRTELLIVLTPQIIRNEADIDRINSDEYARMSWCLGNVIETHGDIGPGRMYEEDVIYSDIGANSGMPIEQSYQETYPSAVQQPHQNGTVMPQDATMIESYPAQVSPMPEPVNALPMLDSYPSTAPPLPNLPQAKKGSDSVLLNSPRNASLFPKSNKNVWSREDASVSAVTTRKSGSVRRVNYEAVPRSKRVSPPKTKATSSTQPAVYRFDEMPGE